MCIWTNEMERNFHSSHCTTNILVRSAWTWLPTNLRDTNLKNTHSTLTRRNADRSAPRMKMIEYVCHTYEPDVNRKLVIFRRCSRKDKKWILICRIAALPHCRIAIAFDCSQILINNSEPFLLFNISHKYLFTSCVWILHAIRMCFQINWNLNQIDCIWCW